MKERKRKNRANNEYIHRDETKMGGIDTTDNAFMKSNAIQPTLPVKREERVTLEENPKSKFIELVDKSSKERGSRRRR